MRRHLHWLSRTKRPHCAGSYHIHCKFFLELGADKWRRPPVFHAVSDTCIHRWRLLSVEEQTNKAHGSYMQWQQPACLQCKFLLHLQRWQAEEPRVVHVTTTTRIHCNWGGICQHTGGGSHILWQWRTGRYACFSGFIDMPRSLKRSPQLHATHSIDMAASRHGSAEVDFTE